MPLPKALLFDPPTQFSIFLTTPLSYLTHKVYLFFATRTPRAKSKDPIRILCISDTHTKTPSLPQEADILIHAGDLSNSGSRAEIQAQADWLDGLSYKSKFVIAGNHDGWLDLEARRYLPQSTHTDDNAKDDDGEKEEEEGQINWGSTIYLSPDNPQTTMTLPTNKIPTSKPSTPSTTTTSTTLTIHGSPYVPFYGPKHFAFQYPTHLGPSLWSNLLSASSPSSLSSISSTTTPPPAKSILITHTPPKHHLDTPTSRKFPSSFYTGMHLGSHSLLTELWRLPAHRKPRLCVFGHIHGSRGVVVVRWDFAQRAYERACVRLGEGVKKGGVLGWVLELGDLGVWRDLVGAVGLGVWGLVKGLAGWGDEGTVMLNAAMEVGEEVGGMGWRIVEI